MCGLTGFWNTLGQVDLSVAEKMASKLQHRGPDDAGTWQDAEAGLALAHRRLSVIDLSMAAHQPMVSPCGRYVLVFNGEIYNHIGLRAVLEQQGGHFNWRSRSDTETLLAALRHWGVPAALSQLNGMFAFALWDRFEKNLYLARDRMGEKPLYYGLGGQTFFFASDLRALACHPDWEGEVDRDALALFLRYGYVPAPWSIYRGIYKLRPAHYLVVREGGRLIPEPVCYWDLPRLAEDKAPVAGNSPDDPSALAEGLEELLHDAVRQRMVADVPLGAFLSGGYDSSAVVAFMQANSHRPVKTFTIGFHETAYNEAGHASAVADRLGTDHTELYVSPEQCMEVIPKLPQIWSEPFSHASQIPTYLVSELARQTVSVSLSGDGGDELFAGYTRHVSGVSAWEKTAFLAPRTRYWLGKVMAGTARATGVLESMPGLSAIPQVLARIDKLAFAMQSGSGDGYYKKLVSHWQTPGSIVIGADEPHTVLDQIGRTSGLSTLRERMLLFDSMTYLPDEVLAKLDRASMAVGLEARVPFLDHRLVEFAWEVPMSLKVRNGQGKWLLRQVLYRYLPAELIDRPKQGFTVPMGPWLRGPLREWAEGLLDANRLRQQGWFDPAPILQCWQEHVSGKGRWNERIWDVLMFQAWLAEHHA